MGRYLKNLNFSLGMALSAVVVVMAVVSLFWTPYGPNAMDRSHRMEGPSMAHPLGTDQYGRDLLSRVMVGAVNCIIVGLMTVVIGMGSGIFLGLLSAWGGRLARQGVLDPEAVTWVVEPKVDGLAVRVVYRWGLAGCLGVDWCAGAVQGCSE